MFYITYLMSQGSYPNLTIRVQIYEDFSKVPNFGEFFVKIGNTLSNCQIVKCQKASPSYGVESVSNSISIYKYIYIDIALKLRKGGNENDNMTIDNMTIVGCDSLTQAE